MAAPDGDPSRASAAALVALPDGSSIRIRPWQDDDRPRLIDAVRNHMTPQDLRMRFFSAIKTLDPALLDHLTHPDPERDIVLVAETADRKTAVAIGRLAIEPAEPAPRAAEFAITVRSDQKGHGIGYALLGRLIDCARERGLAEVFGMVLAENGPMLRMCREYGFVATAIPEEPESVKVVLELA